MASPTIQFKPGEFYKEIERRTSPDGSANITARTMAERYATVCSHSLPFFEVSEWNLIQDYMTFSGPADLFTWRHSVINGIKIDGASKRHNTPDANSLIDRIESLSFAESIAILDRIERFWAEGDGALLPGETEEAGL